MPLPSQLELQAVSSLEKVELEEPDDSENELPAKTQGHFMRNLRHQVFTLYRKLFGLVFVVNIVVFISLFSLDHHTTEHVGLVVVSNLFCAILMRQEYVINAFFIAFSAVPSSWPLSIRRICAQVYHIGGLHSGCAVSGTLWMVIFTAQATRELSLSGPASPLTVIIAYCILLLLLAILALAYPRFRMHFHDYFETSHRFLGWLATALVWVLIISLINDYRPVTRSLGQAVLRAAPFWLVVILTVSIILPWLRLRKVPVKSTVLSEHAVRIYFDHVTPTAGCATHISDSPLMEWHSFAAVREPGKTGHSLVISRAGDWTARQIEHPPTHMWVRGIPTCGVLRILPLFRRVVLVATGSGIGPCASSLYEQRVAIQLLWTSPDVRQTFGDELVDSIIAHSPGAVIHDTRVDGRPDMVKLTYQLVRQFRAEAVCVISNQRLTRKVVYGMMSRGIPAFGPIWDS